MLTTMELATHVQSPARTLADPIRTSPETYVWVFGRLVLALNVLTAFFAPPTPSSSDEYAC